MNQILRRTSRLQIVISKSPPAGLPVASKIWSSEPSGIMHTRTPRQPLDVSSSRKCYISGDKLPVNAAGNHMRGGVHVRSLGHRQNSQKNQVVAEACESRMVADLLAAHDVARRDNRKARTSGTSGGGLCLLPPRGRRSRGVRGKHMGSRAVRVVCRGEDAARRRFGVVGEGIGICYTRTGRRFFDDRKIEKEFLEKVRGAADATGFWQQFETDWICLDAELMP
jgi:hypothetical protein